MMLIKYASRSCSISVPAKNENGIVVWIALLRVAYRVSADGASLFYEAESTLTRCNGVALDQPPPEFGNALPVEILLTCAVTGYSDAGEPTSIL
jgi:hypothetical protein